MKQDLLTLASLCLTAFFVAPDAQEAQALTGPFSSATIDLGVVVSDIARSAEFYGETLGFQEASGFEVGAELCGRAGLTDGKPLSVRVFVLGAGKDATKLKLMEVAGTEPRTSDNHFIHSQLGPSYMTVHVSDITSTLARLQAAGIRPLAAGPVSLGEQAGAPQLALVRDPDGNLIELIGVAR